MIAREHSFPDLEIVASDDPVQAVASLLLEIVEGRGEGQAAETGNRPGAGGIPARGDAR